MYRKYAAALIIAALVNSAPQHAHGDELDELLSGFEDDHETSTEAADTEIDDLLSGFDDQEAGKETEETVKASSLPAWLDLKGNLSLRTAVNFAHDAPAAGTPDYRGLSMFRGLGELIADMSYGGWKARLGGTAFYDGAYHLNEQRDLYTDDYLDEYEREVELGEAYVQGDITENLDIKIGRQIVVWGKSDNLRVTDVLNPLDIRYPGMTDIRYLRLPATMTKLDYFFGDWSSSFILVHEPRFAKTPVYNGEFFPGSSPAPELRAPSWSWENQQPAVSFNGIFSGWDISFYGAWVYPDISYAAQDPSGSFYRTYDKALLTGAAVNVALGNWLLKSEAAFWDDLEYTGVDEEKSRFDILAGIEYSGFTETAITFEIVNRHIFDFEEALALQPNVLKEDTTQYAIRFARDFKNDTLHLNIVLASYGFIADNGGYERVQLDYDFNDSVVLTGGIMLYESGDTPGLTNIGDNDKVFFEVTYNF